jgi:capsular exopolysaccharide synthesis family protein
VVRPAAGDQNPCTATRAGLLGGEDDRQLTARLRRVFGLRTAFREAPCLRRHAGLCDMPDTLLEPRGEARPYWQQGGPRTGEKADDIVSIRSIPSSSVHFRRHLLVLRRHWMLIVVFTILAGAAAATWSYRRTPVYESSSTVMVNASGTSQRQPFRSAETVDMNTHKALARSARVAELAAKALNRSVSPLELLENVEVEVPPNSSILVIRYSAVTPLAAKKGADAFATAYLDHRMAQGRKARDARVRSLTAKLDKLEASITAQDRVIDDPGSSTLQALEAREAKSSLNSRMRAFRTELGQLAGWTMSPGGRLQRADLPDAPVSPNHPVDMGIGLIVGLFLAVTVAFTRDRSKNQLGGREEVIDSVDQPVLAIIPPVGKRRQRQGTLGWRRRDDRSLVMLTDPSSSAAQSYRMLRVHVSRLAERLDVKTIMVTSAAMGEGKSTTAANLAVALAESGLQVLLVSADLRRPRVHEFFSLPNTSGLSNLFADRSASQPQQGAKQAWITAGLWSVAPNLFVIPSGPLPPQPSTLLNSDVMRDFLKEQRDLVDFVILDSPPIEVVADSLALAPLVDAVLVVADAKTTDREALGQVRDQFDRIGANVVGTVLTRSRQKTTSWSRSRHYDHLQAFRSALPGELRGRPLEPPPEPKPAPQPASPSQPSESGADTAAARLVISSLSLACLVAGAAAYAVGVDVVRLGGLLVFGLLGIGSSPWQTNRMLRLPARLTLTMLTSFAVLTFVSVAMLAVHEWRPKAAFAAAVLICVPLHLSGLQLALSDARASGWRWPAREALSFHWWRALAHRRLAPLLLSRSLLCATAGGLLCLGSALAHRHIDPGFFGFLTDIGIAWYIGLALILVAIALSRPDQEHQIAIPVLLLLVVLTLTPSLVYDGPRSQVAAKHVDLILQIRTLHKLNAALDVYNSWHGFFAAMAWLCDITGIRDPIHLATFWPPLLGLFRLATLRYLFGQVLPRPYQAWVAVVIAVLADPIGADYFSPQSVGFVIGMAVCGLALSRTGDAQRLLLIFIAGWVLAMSHQLSPYGVGGALIILVVFRQVRPWWTPLLVLAPAVLWALVHRGALSGLISLKAIGRAQNFQPPKTVASPGLDRLPVVGETVLALVVGVLIVGGIALIALLRHRRQLRLWVLACCPAAGLALVAINPYGQEGIFRATLFGIPWLTMLAAHCFSARGRRSHLALLAVTLALAGTFLVAAFGLDATNAMRPSDLAAFRYFYQHSTGPRHYILALGSGDLPTSLAPETGTFRSVRRNMLDEPVRQERAFDADKQVKTLTARFLEFSRQPPARAQLYAVWSPVSSYYGWAYGLQSPDQFAALRDAFRRSPYWKVVFHQGDTYLFRFDAKRYEGGAA